MKKINLSINSIKNSLVRIKEVLKKIPWILGAHAFLSIIVCFVLAVCFGVFLFYNDVYLAKVSDPEALILPVRFNEQAYQSVVKEWQIRQDLFERAPEQSYSDPFNSSITNK